MKQILLLLSLYVFTACSANLGIQQVLKQSTSINNQITKVISNKSELKSARLKKEIETKLKQNIDFTKDNILIHTVREGSRCKYDEKFVKKDAQHVDIMLVYPKGSNFICMDASINYYFVYKVSKTIKRVGIKAFRHDYIVVDMERKN